MLELFPSDLHVPIWYLLAGFILGFAVSTLWEWLYFRRLRREAIEALVYETQYEAELESSRTQFVKEQTTTARNKAGTIAASSATQATQLASGAELAPPALSYASAGIYLESEQLDLAASRSALRSSLSAAAVYPPRSAELDEALDNDEGEDDLYATEPTFERTNERTSQRRSAAWLIDQQAVENAPSSFEEEETIPADAHSEARRAGAKVTIAQVVPDDQDGAAADNEPEFAEIEGAAPQAELVERTDEEIQPVVALARTPTPPIVALETTSLEITAPQPGSERRPGRVTRSRGYPDDLAEIRGIGEVYKRRLYESHIFTFHHIATSEIDVLRRATHASPNANVEEWPKLARTLAEKYGRLNASYSGPLPDDLTQIPGIGAYFAKTLNRVGICTFAQLADASVEELTSLLPGAVLGRGIQVEDWLKHAAAKAQMSESSATKQP
jgi:predicted flap endonuclease-1-like 5' DNA nuclease